MQPAVPAVLRRRSAASPLVCRARARSVAGGRPRSRACHHGLRPRQTRALWGGWSPGTGRGTTVRDSGVWLFTSGGVVCRVSAAAISKMAKASTGAGMLPVRRVYATREDRPRRDERHAQRERDRTRERARARQRRERGSVCEARVPAPSPMRAYPLRCARVSRRPPTRDVPSQSRPAHRPACARTSTHVHVRVLGTSSPDSRTRVMKLASLSCVRLVRPSSPRSSAPGRGGGEKGRFTTTLASARGTCVRSSRRRPVSNNRVRLLGVGPPRPSRPVARAPRYRT